MNRIAIVIVALVLSATAWWLGSSRSSAVAPTSSGASTPGLDETKAGEMVRAMKSAPRGASAQPAAPTKETPKATYPDGSKWPALNGCGDLEVQWPYGEEFSPIVRRHKDPRGQEWYEHEDGSWSTMQRMEIQGKLTDVPQVFIPKPSAPVEPGAAETGG